MPCTIGILLQTFGSGPKRIIGVWLFRKAAALERSPNGHLIIQPFTISLRLALVIGVLENPPLLRYTEFLTILVPGDDFFMYHLDYPIIPWYVAAHEMVLPFPIPVILHVRADSGRPSADMRIPLPVGRIGYDVLLHNRPRVDLVQDILLKTFCM